MSGDCLPPGEPRSHDNELEKVCGDVMVITGGTEEAWEALRADPYAKLGCMGFRKGDCRADKGWNFQSSKL